MLFDSPVRLNKLGRSRRFLAPINWSRRPTIPRSSPLQTEVPNGSTMRWPCIRSRRTARVSPWMSIIAREVEFSPGEQPQIYHAVEQADYVSIIAVTPNGKLPVVR